MPRTKHDFSQPAKTVIGEGFHIEAVQLTGSDAARVDGRVTGDIVLDGVLQLGPTGYIKGNTRVVGALIGGRVDGNIECRGTLRLAATGVVIGDIATERIIVDEGAILHGMCVTRENIPVESHA